MAVSISSLVVQEPPAHHFSIIATIIPFYTTIYECLDFLAFTM